MIQVLGSRQRAFTLIELLVVISLIGLLSSVVLATVNSAKIKARDARKQADLTEILTTFQRYWLDNNSMPTNPFATEWCAVGVGTCAQELNSPNYFKNGFPVSPLPVDPYYYFNSSVAQPNMPNGYGLAGVHLEKNVWNPSSQGSICVDNNGGAGTNNLQYYCFVFVK